MIIGGGKHSNIKKKLTQLDYFLSTKDNVSHNGEEKTVNTHNVVLGVI